MKYSKNEHGEIIGCTLKNAITLINHYGHPIIPAGTKVEIMDYMDETDDFYRSDMERAVGSNIPRSGWREEVPVQFEHDGRVLYDTDGGNYNFEWLSPMEVMALPEDERDELFDIFSVPLEQYLEMRQNLK